MTHPKSDSATAERVLPSRLFRPTPGEDKMSARRLGREPIAYDEFRQRVRRFRRSDVLRAVASLAVRMQRAAFQEVPPVPVPNYVSEFSLAGVARTALIA